VSESITRRPRPELAQRPAADPAASVWVSASAGTGKTKVLTDRVLRLLLQGTAPQRILCLTFTKAAAAEMSNRIAERLGQWAVRDDAELSKSLTELTGHRPDGEQMTAARRLFARVLDAPGGLAIQTIHGFCQSLLRRFPIEAGVAPHFAVMDERSAAEMLAEAQARVLQAARAEDDPALAAALAAVTRHVNEDDFAGLMRELTAERGRLEQAIQASGGLDGLIAATHRLLGVAPGTRDEDIRAAAAAETAFDGAALRRAAAALAQGSKTDVERGAAIARWLAAPDERAALFDGYVLAFLTADGAPRKTLITKPTQKFDAGADDALKAEAVRLSAVEARRRAALVAAATAALLTLGYALLAAYRREKQKGVLLDYDDLILAARDLLHRPGIAPWVLYKLDGGIDHILIDEAQDTNPEQWQVVEALAAEFFAGTGARGPDEQRTVFAVGDAKQSIFSFQRADPAAFERMRRHFAQRVPAAGAVWREVPLDVSFRSANAVLAAVDAVFARSPARDGVAAGDLAIRHEAFRTGQAGLVELWPPAVPRARDMVPAWQPPVAASAAQAPAARLARLIALKIQGWIAGRDMLESKGRPIRAGDVMILVRRRGSFMGEVVRALKGLGVPVAGVDRMVLTDQLAVMDLTALGQFLLLPDDDLTLATVLKGPLIGLSEERLFELAHGRIGTLWSALRDRAHENPEFARAEEYLSLLLARADYAPPYELYARVLGAGRGRQRILARLGPEAADPLDEFLNAALLYQRAHAPSLQGFLHWLGAAAEEVKRDLEQGQRDEVRVMTVHGAKGLQAPIVILPDTMQKPHKLPRLLWPAAEAGEPPILLWPPLTVHDDPVARAARQAERDKRDREYRRLLYVAMTRAEDRLYVCGWETYNATPIDCWYRLIAAGLDGLAAPADFDFSAAFPGAGANAWAGSGLRLARPQEARAEPERLIPAAASSDGAVPDWLFVPPLPEPDPPKPLAPSRPAGDEPAVRPPFAEDGAEDGAGDSGRRFRRGLILHRLLQALPDLPANQRAEAGRRFLARPVHGLDESARAALLAEALAVLDDPAAAALFGPDSRAEVPVVGRLGRIVVAGQIDRIAITADRVLLVDYKTARTAPAAGEDPPAMYLRQMALYRALLSRIYTSKSIDCYILWTAAPSLVRLEAGLLDRHLPDETRSLDGAQSPPLDSG
jgi:ATP-dependent helicase/nuclease subunit A